MDMERPGKLIKGNADYFNKIAELLHESDDSFKVLTISVTRRLLGQTLFDIASQMDIEDLAVIEVLRTAPRKMKYEELDGQRYAIDTMVKALKRSEKWVSKRVVEYGQYRLNESTAYIKFHQEVFDSLAEQAERAEELPVADNSVYSAEALGPKLSRKGPWVRTQIEKLNITGQIMINPTNFVPTTYYSENDLNILQAEVEKSEHLPVATDKDISINKLAFAVEHSRDWVLYRLPFIQYKPVEKIDPNNPTNQLTLFLPWPESAHALMNLPDDILKKKRVA
jgi:hypothetical protein